MIAWYSRERSSFSRSIISFRVIGVSGFIGFGGADCRSPDQFPRIAFDAIQKLSRKAALPAQAWGRALPEPDARPKKRNENPRSKRAGHGAPRGPGPRRRRRRGAGPAGGPRLE